MRIFLVNTNYFFIFTCNLLFNFIRLNLIELKVFYIIFCQTKIDGQLGLNSTFLDVNREKTFCTTDFPEGIRPLKLTWALWSIRTVEKSRLRSEIETFVKNKTNIVITVFKELTSFCAWGVSPGCSLQYYWRDRLRPRADHT